MRGETRLNARMWVLVALADQLNSCQLHVISRLVAVSLQPAQHQAFAASFTRYRQCPLLS